MTLAPSPLWPRRSRGGCAFQSGRWRRSRPRPASSFCAGPLQRWSARNGAPPTFPPGSVAPTPGPDAPCALKSCTCRAARRIQAFWQRWAAHRWYLRTSSLIVRAQARWRGVLVRQATRVVAERRAVAAGVLAALPRTVPGRTGWYGVDGECFYCVIRDGDGAEWALLYGPEDEERVRAATARAAAEGGPQPLDCDPSGTGFYIDGNTKLYFSRARAGGKVCAAEVRARRPPPTRAPHSRKRGYCCLSRMWCAWQRSGRVMVAAARRCL